jgi:hypothetical protein
MAQRPMKMVTKTKAGRHRHANNDLGFDLDLASLGVVKHYE